MRAQISLLAFVLTALIAPAQRTWIVDENTAAIADFIDIKSAVQAASAGDTILVRPGFYLAPTVTIGIKLIGEPGAELDTLISKLLVHDLKRTETFVLAGFTTRPNFATRLEFTNNMGRIFIENVITEYSTTGYDAGITISESDFVSVNRCKLHGTPGMKVTNSRVVINDCTIIAVRGMKGRAQGNALTAVDSEIDISQPYFSGASDIIGSLGSTAIIINGGMLTVAGDATAYIEGGTSYPSYQRPAIEASECTVRFDTDIRMNRPSSPSPTIAGNAQFLPESLVALGATGQISATDELTATVRGPAMAPAILLISLPSAPVLTPLGILWLDTPSSFLLDTNFLDPTGEWSTSYPVPPNLAKGPTATLQALVDTGSRMVLSLPAMIVSH